MNAFLGEMSFEYFNKWVTRFSYKHPKSSAYFDATGFDESSRTLTITFTGPDGSAEFLSSDELLACTDDFTTGSPERDIAIRQRMKIGFEPTVTRIRELWKLVLIEDFLRVVGGTSCRLVINPVDNDRSYINPVCFHMHRRAAFVILTNAIRLNEVSFVSVEITPDLCTHDVDFASLIDFVSALSDSPICLDSFRVCGSAASASPWDNYKDMHRALSRLLSHVRVCHVGVTCCGIDITDDDMYDEDVSFVDNVVLNDVTRNLVESVYGEYAVFGTACPDASSIWRDAIRDSCCLESLTVKTDMLHELDPNELLDGASASVSLRCIDLHAVQKYNESVYESLCTALSRNHNLRTVRLCGLLWKWEDENDTSILCVVNTDLCERPVLEVGTEQYVAGTYSKARLLVLEYPGLSLTLAASYDSPCIEYKAPSAYGTVCRGISLAIEEAFVAQQTSARSSFRDLVFALSVSHVCSTLCM
jgi:hypothetical protein